MGRRREGYVYYESGSWWARFTYTDGSGKRRNVKWRLDRAINQTDAEDDLSGVLRDFEKRGERALDGRKMKVRDLAKIYKDKKLIAAVYVGERKVAGLRSWKTPRAFVDTLVEHFGSDFIKDITKSDVEEYKLERLNTPTIRGEQRTIASVNRELETLRAMLRFAQHERWIELVPYIHINKADENERMRILLWHEEVALLAACTRRRTHLKPLLIAALDTAMRRGELFKLRWQDIDLVKRTIFIKAMNSRSPRPRTVGITPRLLDELKLLWEVSPKEPNGLVFGIHDTVKRSFTAACAEAGIINFRFHDCRHTAITRMLQAGMDPAKVMKISGHTQYKTFLRYVNPDEVSVKEYADQLAAYNEAHVAVEVFQVVQ
jgi:integrase